MNFHLGIRRAGHRPVSLRLPEALLWPLLLLFVTPVTEFMALRAILRPGRNSFREATVPLLVLGLIRDARGLLIEINDGENAFRLALVDGRGV